MWIICGCEAELTRKRDEYRQQRALVMELLHRYSGLKVSVVYRVSDGLNGLNGLNCLNEQRLIAERVWIRVWVSRDRRATREKIETESKIRKWFLGSHKASQDLARAQILISRLSVVRRNCRPLGSRQFEAAVRWET